MLTKFSKVFFYRTTQTVAPLIVAIKEIALQLNLDLYFEEIFEYNVLQQKIDNHSLLVVFVKLDQHLCRLLYKKGAPMVIQWEHFFQNFASIFRNIKSLSRGEVAFLFLPQNLVGLLEGVFRLHGFKVHIINSLTQLSQLKDKQLFHVVLDQDLSSLKIHSSQLDSVREKSIHYLKQLRFTNQETTIFVVKNFEKGSLFDDINSSVKDISNLLLSYEEYLIFMKTFLSHFSFYKAVQEKENLCRRLHFPAFEKNPWKLLKNPKKIYTELIEKNHILKETCYNTDILFPLMDWQLKELLLSWLVDYSEEIKNRASFRFISGSSKKIGEVLSRPDVADLKLADVASKLTKLPDQNKRVLPHSIHKEPNEPTTDAEGPK